ncbi:MAG: PAS domain S-box protein [Alphaproteobacteria bacterium]|nr:PAS domain S-box protein [Alphaproteobacteria bacterium]
MTDQAMEGEGTAAGARATRGLNRARVIAAGALLAALASLLVMLFLFSAGGWQQGLLSIGLLGIAVALWQIGDMSERIVGLRRRDRVVADLAVATRRLRRLIEELPTGAVLVRGETVVVNKAIASLTGLGIEEMTTLDGWFAAIAGPRAGEARRFFAALPDAAKPRLVPILRRDGRRRVCELVVLRQDDETLWLLADVTDQLAAEGELRDAEDRFRRAIANIPGLVLQFRIDALGRRRITYVSERSREFYGCPPAVLQAEPGRLFVAILPDDRRRLLRRIEQAVRDHAAFAMECRVRAGAGIRWRRVQARPERDADGSVSWDAIVTDIDEVKRAEEEARLANAAKSEFLSRMSHELRTPLNAILGFAQLLEKLDANDRQLRYLGYIAEAGAHLMRLMDEVLELSKIEAGAIRVELEPVDLGQTLKEVVTLMAPAAAKAGITLNRPSASDIPVLRADRVRLRQVLINLVSNAIKYNRPQGAVTMEVAHSGDSHCRIMVTDQGAGIPPDRQQDLFVAFNRLGAEQSGIEGVGIGLVITKRLVELMHGRISFESSPDGTTFRVDLPIVAPRRRAEFT